MATNHDVLIELGDQGLGGSMEVFEDRGKIFTYIALNGQLRQKSITDIDLYIAFINNIKCDHIIIDVSKFIITADNTYDCLIMLLILIVSAKNEVIFITGNDSRNVNFLHQHFSCFFTICETLCDAFLDTDLIDSPGKALGP